MLKLKLVFSVFVFWTFADGSNFRDGAVSRLECHPVFVYVLTVVLCVFLSILGIVIKVKENSTISL